MPPRSAPKRKPKQSTLDFRRHEPPSVESSKTTKPLSNFSQPPRFSTPPNLADKGKQKAFVPPVTSAVVAQLETDKERDNELWVDKYQPKTKDLAVHKLKVDGVSRWLEEAFEISNEGGLRKYRKVLALTGPAGAGKTATIRALAQSSNIDILEWKAALDDWKLGDSESIRDDRLSISRKLEQFLNRGLSLPSLAFSSPLAGPSSRPPVRKQLLLIDDIPNVQNLQVREAFHDALVAFVNHDRSSSCPLVIVISDLGIRGESWSSDSGVDWRTRQQEKIDFRTVLPKCLHDSPFVTEIQFNPIAVTLLRKALTAILIKQYKPNPFPFPKEVIDAVLDNSNGDIRCALHSLQFAGRVHLEIPAASSRKKGDKAKRANATRVLIDTISQRDQSLEMFHLLGKILYNKRFGENPKEDVHSPPELHALPSHLDTENRRQSKVDLNALYGDSPIDASLLALYIHQNYGKFCQDVNNMEAVSEWLSFVDFLSSNAEIASQGVSSQYAFYLTAAGTLHSLPTPVPRLNQKLTKPEWFESLRRSKIVQEQVNATRMWLCSAEGATQQSQAAIVTEFATVIPYCVPEGSPHRAFTAFADHPSRLASTEIGDHDVQDDDYLVEAIDSFEKSRVAAIPDEPKEGWLSDDGIEEW